MGEEMGRTSRRQRHSSKGKSGRTSCSLGTVGLQSQNHSKQVEARRRKARMIAKNFITLKNLLVLLSFFLLQTSSGMVSPQTFGLRLRGDEDPSLGDVYANMDPVQYTGPSDWVIHDPSKIVATDGLLMIAVTAQEDGYMCGLETWYIS